MHVEKSPLKINEKQTYFNEKHKKNNNPEKTADLTVQPGEPYSDLNKIFILFKWRYRPFSFYNNSKPTQFPKFGQREGYFLMSGYCSLILFGQP